MARVFFVLLDRLTEPDSPPAKGEQKATLVVSKPGISGDNSNIQCHNSPQVPANKGESAVWQPTITDVVRT
jgi:hypothetical protein